MDTAASDPRRRGAAAKEEIGELLSLGAIILALVGGLAVGWSLGGPGVSSRLDSPVVLILALVVVTPAVSVVLVGMIGVFASFGFGNSPFAASDAAISFVVERLWLGALWVFALGMLVGLLLGNRAKP